MRTITAISIALIAAITCAQCVCAEEPRTEMPADLILQRFAIDKGRGALLLPVRIGAMDHFFVLDSGSNTTLLDATLCPGDPKRVVTADGPEGKVDVKIYTTPTASVGKLPLAPLKFVLARDLTQIRRVFGDPIEGILGMDFLHRYVVHVNFDKGEVLFLRSAPIDAGNEVPLGWDPDSGLPRVDAELVPGESTSFVIDTGNCGLESGNLTRLEMRTLAKKHGFRQVSTDLAESLSGRSTTRSYQGKVLRLGVFSVESPVLGESSINMLGLGFWSRFTVTFDSPESKLYLRKGDNYSRPDRWNLSGLHLLNRQRCGRGSLS